MGYDVYPRQYIAGVENEVLLYDSDNSGDFEHVSEVAMSLRISTKSSIRWDVLDFQPIGGGSPPLWLLVRVVPHRGFWLIDFILGLFSKKMHAGTGALTGNLKGPGLGAGIPGDSEHTFERADVVVAPRIFV